MASDFTQKDLESIGRFMSYNNGTLPDNEIAEYDALQKKITELAEKIHQCGCRKGQCVKEYERFDILNQYTFCKKEEDEHSNT